MTISSVAIVTSMAYSLANFRGPLIAQLVAKGVRVYALAPDYDAATRQAVTALGAEPVAISMDRTGMRPLRDGRDFVGLVGLLRTLRPDAVLCYFMKPVIYGSLAATLARVPTRIAMVEGLGYIFTQSGRPVSLRQRLLRWLSMHLYSVAFRAAHRVILLNKDDLEQFIGASVLAADKAVLLGGIGVDLARLSPVPPVADPLTFLLMARLLREKGICEYVEAARLVRARHGNVRFVLLGGLDPNPGGLTRDDVQSWADEGVVEWPGHVDDVRPWIVQSSVYVMPSYYREGVPRSTQEAMAMGRPVITTDNVGCRDTVDDGVNGFLVPVRDSQALAAAMQRFIEQPDLVRAMGRESRRLAEERFDVHKINAVMLEVLGIS